MFRVKCAHCGAGNTHVTEKDTCFQCGNILGEAPAPRTYNDFLPLAATMDLSTLTAEQMPPRMGFANRTGLHIAFASQRSLALAAVGTVLFIAFGMAALLTVVH